MINEDDDDGIINDSIISTEDLLEALKIGRKYVEDLERLEADLVFFQDSSKCYVGKNSIVNFVNTLDPA